MATPGTPSGENHSSDNQKCGRKLPRPRPSSSCCNDAIRSARTLPSMVTPSWHMRRSSRRSSGQSAHSSGGSTGSFAIPPVYGELCYTRRARPEPNEPQEAYESTVSCCACRHADADDGDGTLRTTTGHSAQGGAGQAPRAETGAEARGQDRAAEIRGDGRR